MPPRKKWKKWTPEEVIDEIRRCYRKGEPFSEKTHCALYHAARVHVGDWHKALRLAGIKLTRKKWSKASVIEAIRRRHKRDLPLRILSDQRLTNAAVRYFGSWDQALAGAGIDTGSPSPAALHVIQEIRSRYQQGLSLARADCRSLADSAAVQIGSWEQALDLAGARSYRKPWSRAEILNTIRDRHRLGIPLTTRFDQRLAHAARRLLGGWNQALSMVGVKPRWKSPRGRWSRESLVEAIQTHWQRHGNLTCVDHALYGAAVRQFNNWHTAVRASGLKPQSRIRWSRERVVDGLRKHRYPAPLDSRLQSAARYLFGSMATARKVAGITDGPPPRQRWTQEAIIQYLQDRYTSQASLNSKQCKPSLVNAARRQFGSWHATIRAAGLGHLIVRHRIRHPNYKSGDQQTSRQVYQQGGQSHVT